MEIRVSDFDLVKSDKKTIDTQKVLLKMWEYKKNTEIISELANILSKFVDEKRVFADIEFFLPQIAHLTIHLDHAAKIESLEYLLILIAQTSMHAALQLCFIFSAALEDFQPELSGGQPNPANNPFLFRRCARLLEDIERAVIYGSPSIGASEAKRDEVASTLSRMKSSIDGQLCGDLFYKRLERKSTFHSKTWKSRYFVVDKRVLLCYHDPYAVNPVRSVHLQNARVVECDPHPKYGDTVFEVVNESTNSRFLLRAADATSRRKWINVLQSQINGAPPVLVADASEKAEKEEWSKASEKSVIPAIPMDAMTPIQRKRFSYFRQ
jgi:phosphatidylinositol 4-kinase